MNFFLSFLLSNFRKNMILPSPPPPHQLEILDPLLILTSGVKKLSEKLWPPSSIHELPLKKNPGYGPVPKKGDLQSWN